MDVEIKSEVEDSDSLVEADFSCEIYDYSSAARLDQSIESGEPFGSNLSDSCCKVCGDSATGMYFGALVCVPCKTFFLRYGGGSCIFECKFDKNCEITSTSRTQCKYCRYQKCIQAGMCRKVRPTQVHLNEGQQLCVVCNDVANGVHFGAITCEGCKKFFRRGLTEHHTYSCKNDKTCLVNPRTRNSCRYCRYQKCLSAGMSREAIQMGRPSKIRTVNGIGSDGLRLKEPKTPKNSSESRFGSGATEDWLKYYTEPAFKYEMFSKSNSKLKEDYSGSNSRSKLVTNGSKTSIKIDSKSDSCVNSVSDVRPLSFDAVSDKESRSNSSADEDISNNFESCELQSSKTYCHEVNCFVPSEKTELKPGEVGIPTSAPLDSLSCGRTQISTKTESELMHSANGKLNGLFTSVGKWKSSNSMPRSLQFSRALSMSSGGYCQLNSTSPLPLKQTYSEIEDKEQSSKFVASDSILTEFNIISDAASVEFGSLNCLLKEDKTKHDRHLNITQVHEVFRDATISHSNGDMPRTLNDSLSDFSPAAASSPCARALSDFEIGNPSELSSASPHYVPPVGLLLHTRICQFDACSMELENVPTACSLESMPSFSSALADISLISPNSTSSRLVFPSSTNKWRQPSDRDSPYCTIFALASSCQLFSEASKNPFERDGSCDNERNVFESICSEHQTRITQQYWMEPVLPDENIIFNEKHKEIIKQILSAYERFVQTGTNVNETLRTELEHWQTSPSDMNASLSEWIQSKVVPVYTFSSITYCKSLPGFQDFATKDQATLIRLGQSQSRILVAANHWYDPEGKKFHDFLSWRSEDLFKKKLIKYAEMIHSLELDRIESAVLNVLILIATDYPGLKRPQLIEESRQNFLCAFRAYTTAKYGTPNKRLETLFRHIPECRSLGFLHYKMTMTASLRAEEAERMFPAS